MLDCNIAVVHSYSRYQSVRDDDDDVGDNENGKEDKQRATMSMNVHDDDEGKM